MCLWCLCVCVCVCVLRVWERAATPSLSVFSASLQLWPWQGVRTGHQANCLCGCVSVFWRIFNTQGQDTALWDTSPPRREVVGLGCQYDCCLGGHIYRCWAVARWCCCDYFNVCQSKLLPAWRCREVKYLGMTWKTLFLANNLKLLKRHSTNFTHEDQFTCSEEYSTGCTQQSSDVFWGSGRSFSKFGISKLDLRLFSRKSVLQTGDVEFERCGRLPAREGLIRDNTVGSGVFLSLTHTKE